MNLSFSWLREFKKEHKAHDSIPLTSSPTFPWEELSLKLASTFECDEFNIQPHEPIWRIKSELLENLGGPLTSLSFILPNLSGSFYWIMTKQEIQIMESLLLTKEIDPFAIQDEEFKNSFYRFLVMETLFAINQVDFDPALIPVITDSEKLPEEDALCMDIAFSIDQRQLHGRLVIPPAFRKSITKYFSQNGPTESTQKLADQIELPLQIEVGRTQLSLTDWKNVSLGDFITLDRCSLNQEDLTGHALLTMQGKPIFKGALEGNHIQIMDFPFIHEEETFMAKHHDNEENDNEKSFEEDEDDLSDLDFDDEDDLDEFDEELFDEIEDEEEEEEEDLDEPEEDEHLAVSEEKETSEELPEKSEAEQESISNENDESALQSALQMPNKGPVSADQIPVTLVVQLGSIQMTMNKLLQIEAGNLLDIDIQPENGVDLTINGRVVAKAELIRIGENLGVRILELG